LAGPAESAWGRLRRQQSFVVRAADERFGRSALDARLKVLGRDGTLARDLDGAVQERMAEVVSLSPLTEALALQYLERLARPVPSLTPPVGVQITGRSYVAHMVVEIEFERFGAADVPVLGTLPPLKKGRPPQDLLSRVVKASRGKGFWGICALSPGAWEGYVDCLTKRAHDAAPAGDDLVTADVVDGVARFAWVLRQVDLHYGLQPERR
jgi:hypothetical protein